MKNFTAIYSTEAIKNIQYSFKAEDVDSAIVYAQGKFNAFPNVAIIENTREEENANEGRLVFLNGEKVR
jgi:hypothetical protein